MTEMTAEVRVVANMFSIMFALVAFFISLSLRLKLGSLKEVKKTEDRLFIRMVNILIVCSILNPVRYCVNGADFPGSSAILIAVATVSMVLYLFLMFTWMNFVDYKFFQSKGRIERRGKKAFIPLAVMLVLLVINIPTGILFNVTSDGYFRHNPLWIMGFIIQLSYLFYTTILVKKYKDLYGGLHFFSIKEFVIPFLVGVIFNSILADWVFVTLASAIGLTTIYINILREKVYIDPVTDLYNSYFLDRVFEEIKTGDYDFSSAILFKLHEKEGSGGLYMITETAKAASEVIAKVMPEGCETMYMGSGELLVLTKVKEDQESAIKLLCMMFGETLRAAGYDKLTVDHSYAFRGEGQSANDFLRRLGSGEEAAA